MINIWVASIIFMIIAIIITIKIGVILDSYIIGIILITTASSVMLWFWYDVADSPIRVNDKSITETYQITELKEIEEKQNVKYVFYDKNEKECEITDSSKIKEIKDENPYYEETLRDYKAKKYIFYCKVKDKEPERTYYLPSEMYNKLKYDKDATISYYTYEKENTGNKDS